MLHKSRLAIQRQLFRHIFVVSSAKCHVCKCKICGSLITQKSNQRSYGTKRQAPSTWRKNSNAGPPTTWLDKNDPDLLRWLGAMYRTGSRDANPSEAMKFLEDVEARIDKRVQPPTIEPKTLMQIQTKYNMSSHTVSRIAEFMLRGGKNNNTLFAKTLVFSLSRAGHADATLFVMSSSLRRVQRARKPELLQSPQIAHARAHLTALAEAGENTRAMVLEGQIAREMGHYDRAISLLTDAVEGSLQILSKGESKQPTLTRPWHREPSDYFELSSPWIDLMLIHYERFKKGSGSDMEKSKWAMEIGCTLGDPMSHYYAASFNKRIDANGTHIATSDWLYHISKAASSGHPKACHELAVFYAESGWKYIEDEPPDHIKPTPFDSYPAPSVPGQGWHKLLVALGLKKRTAKDSSQSLFQSAIYPSTPADRFKLAFGWINMATDQYYAPSFLFKAKMYMQQTLWGQAQAPRDAVRLDPKRWTYSSKTNYESGKLIASRKKPKELPDPPNPFYDIEEAKDNLRQVFNACEANATRAKFIASFDGEGDEDKAMEYLSITVPARLAKWLRNVTTWDTYASQLPGLQKEAREICDREGWDIYDDGTLLYRHRPLSRT